MKPRREGDEQCDGGAEGDGSVGGCNPDCTLRSVHDSVVLPLQAVQVKIPVGNAPFTANVIVQVQNADVSPVRETLGHAIRLTASDGDCPAGTVTGQPDFDRGIDGAQIKPIVRRSKDLPRDVAEVEVTVSASDGDCPAGTVGFVDFDRRTAGHQSRLLLRRGRRAKGSLGLIVRAGAFDSPSDESPRRCTALIVVTGEGDTDPSNNTTRLVIDVMDRNDF